MPSSVSTMLSVHLPHGVHHRVSPKVSTMHLPYCPILSKSTIVILMLMLELVMRTRLSVLVPNYETVDAAADVDVDDATAAENADEDECIVSKG